MEEREGWIKLHRKLLDHTIVSAGDPYLLQLWVYILLRVNHKTSTFVFNSQEQTLHPGQGIFGLNQIVRDLANLTNEKSRNFRKMKILYYRKLKILENMQNLQLQPTNRFTIVTVSSWDRYQSDVTPVKLQRNSSVTPVKTNKNVKNDREVNISKDIGGTPKVNYGNENINKLGEVIDHLLDYKVTTSDRRRVLQNMVSMLEKFDSKGRVKPGREWLNDSWNTNAKAFCNWFDRKFGVDNVKQPFQFQSWRPIYEKFKLWHGNEGKIN